MSEMNSSEIWVAFPFIDNMHVPRCVISRGRVFDPGSGRQALAYNEGHSVRMIDKKTEQVFSSEGEALRHCAKFMREKSDAFAVESDRLLAAAVATEIVVVT